MYLYNLTLQKQTAIYQTISGSFTAPKVQEIVFSKGNILELCTIDQNGKIKTLISKQMFGQVRKIAPFRLTGNHKDYIVIGSDSGRIVILEASLEHHDFIKLHQETYGKTGCRRIVPGEYIAVDPKGRAILIAAIEKQKFVYIMNRDKDVMTISSAHEAHKSNTICFDICGIDVGYDNPLFAAIEVEYGAEDEDMAPINTGQFQKILVYYELDLNLNHVVRKNAEKIDMTAHMIVPVSKGKDYAVGGLVIFCEGYAIYKGANGLSKQTIFPLRNENDKRRGMIINHAVYAQKNMFYIIAQSEFGDLFKISLQLLKEKVNDLIIEYYDTVPIAHSISLLFPGYIFSASETGNHHLYYMIAPKENDKNKPIISNSSTKKLTFNPRDLVNLQSIDDLVSFSIITDMSITDLTGEGSSQIYMTSGKGPRSSLHVLRPGLSVTNIAVTSLTGDALQVWSLKQTFDAFYDKYIIVSFINATLVLEIGNNISEVSNSGFDLKNSTIHVGILSDGSFIQVTKKGIIHIKKDKKAIIKFNSGIVCACSNQKQIIVGLEVNEIAYLELDNDNLSQSAVKVLKNKILCLDLGPIPEERLRSNYMAVGCDDKSIHILSLSITIEQCLTELSIQVLPYAPLSVAFVKYDNEILTSLFVGLENGVLIKTAVDNNTGRQTDMQTKYLGSKPVSLFKIRLQEQEALTANSTKPFLCFKHMGKYCNEIINMESIEALTSFNSERCHEGIVTIERETLKIITIDRLDQFFSQQIMPLRYTPRKLLVNKENGKLIVIESDQHVNSQQKKEMIKTTIGNQTEDEGYNALEESSIGVPYAPDGNWGSCIRIIDPTTLAYDDLNEFEGNEAALSACLMTFSSNPNETYLILGTAEELKFHPSRSFTSANIIVFLLKDKGTKLEFQFKQPVDDIPFAFAEYQGRLLAGIGNILILYDIGKSHLLKKCETKKITNTITQIQTNGQRILINTMNESFFLLRHRATENQFYIFADDIIPRWLTNATFLDYDTIAGADKFENFFVYRLPSGADEENKDDPMGSKKKWEVGYMHGAAYKLNLIAQFHVGDLITSLKKTSLCGNQDNMILYATASGAVGAFIPLETRPEVDFFVHMEMYSRIEISNHIGRDHQMYRSSYGPVKCVIDGDLCEEYLTMQNTKQKALARQLDKEHSEVTKMLQDIHNKII